ncbi:MAG: TPM domain-containing protein [Candidatus Zixiibacteriota bacterium]|nr:MAG: TPM domain-containing protein [candidate division Zixibacteria bacterium]
MIGRIWILLLLSLNIGFASVPRPLGWVSDYAGLFDRGGIDRITDAIAAIKTSTGAEIAVVTQNSMGEFGSREEMALAYLEEWGLGERGKDNGLLILILYDRNSNLKEYRFETGLGLEGDLPDGLLGQIVREEMVPRFRQGDFSGGVLAAVVRIGNILGADLTQVPAIQKTITGKRGIGSSIFIALIILMLLSRVISGKGRGGGLLALLMLGSMMGSRGRIGGFGGGGFGGGSFGGFGGGGGGAGGGAGGSW